MLAHDSTTLLENAPKRVLMTADTVGGVWTYAMQLARALRIYDVQIILATMGAPLNADQRQEAETLDNLQICQSNYKLEWMPEPWRDVSMAGQWLLSLEERFEPDVIHLNGYSHGNLAWSAPVLMAGHSCVLSWWSAVKKEEAPECWNTYRENVGHG
ncbi:MAG TPA: glycosyltransferase, partial [Verrucomicrobiae bacterium]